MIKFHHYLLKLYNLHKNANMKEFARMGLSSGQPKILEILSRNDGCAQKDLASACELQAATVSSLVVKMEKDGLVRRIPKNLENGTHITEIFLTPKGKELTKQVLTEVDKIEYVCFNGFSEQEKNELLSYLDRINNNLLHFMQKCK